MKKIIIIFVMVEILDVITTIIGLHYFGFLESNILVANFGWAIANVIKVLVILCISIFLNWGYKFLPKLFVFYGIATILASGFPVVNNIVLLLTT